MYTKHLKQQKQHNLVFGLTIHPDSKLLQYLFIFTANNYSTFLLHFILRSALFDASVPPVSAINWQLDSPCIYWSTTMYLYGITCVVLFLKTSEPATETTGSKFLF